MKNYSKYKLSGIEWIGEIPIEWFVAPIRWIARVFSGGTPNKDKPEFWNSDDIPWLSSGEVNNKRIYYSNAFISTLGFNNSSAKWIQPESILIALAGQGKTKGTVATLHIKATCNQSMAALEPVRNIINYNYLYYYLDSNYLKIRGLVGDDRDGLNLDLIKSIHVPVPTIIEQATIASFLDQKTTLIDETIAKKQRLIEFLQEERTTLINQAITKGLDPNVKMKPSGVEWLGDIPEHWEMKKIKYLITKNGLKIGPFGSSLNYEFVKSSGFKIYGQENVIKDDFSLGVKYLDKKKFEELAVYEILPEDIVITMMGTTGRCKVVPIGIEKGIMDSHLIRLRIENEIFYPHFIALIINDSHLVYAQIKKMSKGSIMEGLNSAIIKSLVLPVPPRAEQDLIFSYVLNMIKEIAIVINKATCEISLLQEYRTALISEVVTGKVCVLNESQN